MIRASPRQAPEAAHNPKVGGTAVDPGLRDGPVGRPDKSSTGCGRTEPWRFSHLPGNKDRRFRVNDVLALAEERVVANRATERFARRCQSLPLGREYGSVVTHQLHSGVTLRDLIEREREGS